MDICGVDWPEREPSGFDVVYNLLSVTQELADPSDRAVRTIRSRCRACWPIWPVATWFEREAWDLYGIHFAGQPDHRRILTDYGFNGHPLRKDFPLTGYVEVRWDEERKQVVNEPVSLTADFRNFDFVSPWEGMVTLPGDEKAHEARKSGGPVAGDDGAGGMRAARHERRHRREPNPRWWWYRPHQARCCRQTRPR